MGDTHLRDRSVGRTRRDLGPLAILLVMGGWRYNSARGEPRDGRRVGNGVVGLVVAHLAHDGNLAMRGRRRHCSRADGETAIVVHDQTAADVALRGSRQMALHKAQLADRVIGARLGVRKRSRHDVHDSHSAIIEQPVACTLVLAGLCRATGRSLAGDLYLRDIGYLLQTRFNLGNKPCRHRCTAHDRDPIALRCFDVAALAILLDFKAIPLEI